ncbi:hypothetical protein [Streptomyces californicus]|uniref:hypothetical protein n=1 Tax=Streptomyces californicus TaxID=67351 RepID=UPI0036BF36C5
MTADSRTARLKKMALPGVLILVFVGWITAITVGISNEPDSPGGAPSRSDLASDVQSAIHDRDGKALREYFSPAAGDDYGKSLVDKLSAGASEVKVSEARSGQQPFLEVTSGDNCLGFDILHEDDAWFIDAVPRVQGCAR